MIGMAIKVFESPGGRGTLYFPSSPFGSGPLDCFTGALSQVVIERNQRICKTSSSFAVSFVVPLVIDPESSVRSFLFHLLLHVSKVHGSEGGDRD